MLEKRRGIVSNQQKIEFKLIDFRNEWHKSIEVPKIWIG